MSDLMQVVAIDGPSGGGKSTVSRGLASKLGFTYLDTGAMYRAVAFACRDQQIKPSDERELKQLLQELVIELLPAVNGASDVQVVVNGKEVGRHLRTPEMGMLASQVSAIPAVRAHLTQLQQDMGKSGKIVAEGRDTGTVVYPRAAWKFFLDAKPEIRMRRRADQLRSQGAEVNEQDLLAQIIQRDRDDSKRAVAPLKQATDAVYIDSSDKSAEEVISLMYERILHSGCPL
ncbi:(d)CMP kinase [Desulfogranum marinum]|jgi:cytidylate kinase|uniref:(d)CMP kinase n=1 Tax=Desulfogranum marinum TaxID=453220 RepID=UPI001962F5A4|nr:(d)CMP kinase [Desulfogranum marinum]MBM9512652.1 (d)CMP kinase [Desulfogranum marinum]